MNTQILTPLKPTRMINFARIHPLFERVGGKNLMATRGKHTSVRLATRFEAPPTALQARGPRKEAPAQIKEVPVHELSVPRGEGSMSRMGGTADLNVTGSADIRLPAGMPRFVNAATLKRMLGAARSELLLKRTGERWDICEDSTRIDLTDETVEFRLGTVQIFS